jgi:transcription-repair coupling factor (superfamily II helicase)
MAEQNQDGWSKNGEFCIKAPFAPTGDQPEAINAILQRLEHDCRFTVLRGATGTGKTFAIANVIQGYKRPTLLLCHNKTLAAQLARELKSYFPANCVELFVSYYDYYQPEAYLAASDTYIAKTTSINEELDALRHRATRALCERRDVIVVSTVSCIYGLGLPANYLDSRLCLSRGETLGMPQLWLKLRAMLYQQAAADVHRDVGGGRSGEGGARRAGGRGGAGGRGVGERAEDLQRGFFSVQHSICVCGRCRRCEEECVMCMMICYGCGRWGTLSTFRICSCGLRMRRYEEAPVRA